MTRRLRLRVHHLQVALSATKSELDITKTLMKMEMDELSQVLHNQRTATLL